jgi:hypothetical protein
LRIEVTVCDEKEEKRTKKRIGVRGRKTRGIYFFFVKKSIKRIKAK